MTESQRRYYRRFGVTSPTCAVYRVAGRHIRARAEAYFHGRLLDVGCGTKAKQLLVGDLVDEYVGLDHPDTPHGIDNVDLIGTAYEIPESEEAFDSLLCTSVLEHLEEPGRALREAHRVLKRGGHAIYTMPQFWHLHEEPRDFYRYTEYGCRYLFENAGFEVVEIAPLSGFCLTFATEAAYYWQSVFRGPLRFVSLALNVVVNTTAPIIDRLDRGINPNTRRFTWLHLVVARKPQS